MNKPWTKKIAGIALACAASLSLSGCLILPGEFTSDMTVRKNGEFTFNYKGQIQLLGLASLLNQGLDAMEEDNEFTATCYVDDDEEEAGKDKKLTKAEEKAEKRKEKARDQKAADDAALSTMGKKGTGSAASTTAQEDFDLSKEGGTPPEDAAVDAEATEDEAAPPAVAVAVPSIEEDWELEERDCTEAEIAEQKKQWEEERAERKKKEEAAKKMFAQLLGGIDPKDPETIKRFTKEVERLAAWNKVEHLGDGLFIIDYSTSGKLGDDFAFPVIPRYALGEPMIHITRWDNGRVRVEAPAFQNDPDLSIAAMIGAGGMMDMGMPMGKESKKAPRDIVPVKGTFTLTTDANILANNTEEGPEDGAGGLKVLRWEIGSKIYGAPMALLKLIN